MTLTRASIRKARIGWEVEKLFVSTHPGGATTGETVREWYLTRRRAQQRLEVLQFIIQELKRLDAEGTHQ